MTRLFRLTIMLSISLTLLACACYSGVAAAYRQSGGQSLKHGELELASSQFGRVSAPNAATHEPMSLALFGFGLTLAGVTLLRSSRRTKWPTNTRDAHGVVDKSYVRVARAAHGGQYPRPDLAARDRFAATYMPSGSR